MPIEFLTKHDLACTIASSVHLDFTTLVKLVGFRDKEYRYEHKGSALFKVHDLIKLPIMCNFSPSCHSKNENCHEFCYDYVTVN